MAHAITRRDFFKTSAMITGGALATSLLKPFEAEGQIAASFLALEGFSGPIILIATMVEAGWILYDQVKGSRETKGKLADMAGDIANVANNQETIIRQLADMRLVIREELNRASLKKDAAELYGISRQFKDALSDDDRQEIEYAKSRIDVLAPQMFQYGLVGVPAYLNAIALQNGIHYTLGSPPARFVSMNQEHQHNLNTLLTGSGENTLADYRRQIVDTLPRGGFDEGNLEVLRNQIGRRFLFALVSTQYKAGDNDFGTLASTHEYGVIYKGFKNGKPVLEGYRGPEIAGQFENHTFGYSDAIQGKQVQNMEIWFDAVSFMAGDYKTIKGLLPFEDESLGSWKRMGQAVNLKDDGTGTIRGYLTDDQAKIVESQTAAVANYYTALYDRRMGPNITANSRNPQPEPPPNAAYEGMRELLTKGSDAVGRILSAANSGFTAAPASFAPEREQQHTPYQRPVFQRPTTQQKQTYCPYNYCPPGSGH